MNCVINKNGEKFEIINIKFKHCDRHQELNKNTMNLYPSFISLLKKTYNKNN